MADRIRLRDLSIRVDQTALVDGVGFDLEAGSCLAMAGPSGAGKSLTSRALLGLVDFAPGVVSAQLEIAIDGVVHRPWAGCIGGSQAQRDRAFAPIRGSAIGLLPQDARDALDPLRTVGWQVAHAGRSVDVLRCLERSGLQEPARVAKAYPHELSGGMARRVTIAQALACQARFLIVDEPTTGLDAVGVVALCAELRRLVDAGLGLLLITHDLRILPGLADRVLFVQGGRVVETVASADLDQATSELAVGLVQATQRIRGRRLS